jgi:hypothetical protein
MRAIRSAVRDHELHEVQCSLRLTPFGAVCWQDGAAVRTPTERSQPHQPQAKKQRPVAVWSPLSKPVWSGPSRQLPTHYSGVK